MKVSVSWQDMAFMATLLWTLKRGTDKSWFTNLDLANANGMAAGFSPVSGSSSLAEAGNSFKLFCGKQFK
jgi:hypothetical protein